MSIEFIKDEPLWNEKYRPQKLSDCILRPDVARDLKNLVQKGHLGNILFHGQPGTSKTTTAVALCKTMNLDWDIVNASSERGIDMIRDRLESFASSASLSGNGKAFICDESCRLTPNALDALKTTVERFSKHCSFIMTANHPNRLTDAIRSRFTFIDFNPSKDEEEQMQAQLFVRLRNILDNESIKYDDMVLIELIKKHYPDNREIVRLLQYYSGNGVIDAGILMLVDSVTIDSLVNAIKSRKYSAIVEFAENNAGNDTSAMYETLYRAIVSEVVDKKSIPDLVTIINDYQRYDSIVPSKMLHLVAMATEIMSNVDFKK